jgi:hypothetical protein
MDMKRHMLIYVFIFIQVGATRLEPFFEEGGKCKEQKQTKHHLVLLFGFIVYGYQKVFVACSHGKGSFMK